jgi:hypothetical protein
MKTTRESLSLSILCGCLFGLTANAQIMLENFEGYPSDTDLQAAWFPDMDATLTLSTNVAFHSTGTNCMRVDISVPANAWQTTVLTGPTLPAPIAISPSQYIALRVAGDPQYTNSTYNVLYVYAWDGNGNFGRWGAAVPTTTTNWQVLNLPASTVEKPWDSSALPDLNNIVQFKFYLYGQGDPAGTAFSATIYIDELQVRNSPLIEFPPPSPMRALIDDFEGYADDAALTNSYHYVNGAATTVTTASLQTPAPQGTKALKLAMDFGAGQWPWGSVSSGIVAPFSLPTNALVSLWLKGDPTLAPVADDGTVFYLRFYDAAGNRINYTTPAAPVISSGWTKLEASLGQFWSSSVVDTGNLVQWQILVEGWQGTADSTPLSAAFYVDNIRITVPPVLAIVPQGSALVLQMSDLIPGTTYTLRQTSDFSQWTTTTIQATSASQIWPIPAGQKGFFQLFYPP